MKYLWLILALALNVCAANFEAINPEAEKAYAEVSFALAHKLYAAMDLEKLSAEERRWVEFRRADTLWRSAQDESGPEKAERELERLIAGRERKEQQDRVWAEAQESLGRLMRERPSQDWRKQQNRQEQSIEHLREAMDWWAGSREIELARKRYAELALDLGQESPEVLENLVAIAQTDEDKGRALYQLATSLQHRYGVYNFDRVAKAYEGVIALGKKTEWYDDALHQFAQWLTYSGKMRWTDEGYPIQEPNLARALGLFEKLVAEFRLAESGFVREAQRHIQQIRAVDLRVVADVIFLPNTPVELTLHWKNLKSAEFVLRRADLLRDFRWRETPGPWNEKVDPAAGEVVKRWTRDLKDDGDFRAHNESIAISEKLEPGTYSLEVTGGGKRSVELILVSDLAVVTKAGTDRVLVFVCNAQTGVPVNTADVRLLEHVHDGRNNRIESRNARTGEDGLAEFAARPGGGNGQMIALAMSDGRPALAIGHMPGRYSPFEQGEWKFFTVTDRPAYRPGETMHWKTTVRTAKGGAYATPAGEKVKFTIMDARGSKVKEGEATLNSFGSAWGELALTSEMALGPYTIQFEVGKNRQTFAGGQFRLEEYKLPEFKVTVETPLTNGAPKAFRLGERVEVTVKSEFYFGGPVANATVKVVVKTNSLYRVYHWPRAYPWFYEERGFHGRGWRGNQGAVALEKELTTDAEGKATLAIDTANFGQQDIEMTIEARVTDSSRREIIGNGTVRVTKQRYQVFAQAVHNLHRPGDRAEVTFKALDANERGVSVEGRVKVTREIWKGEKFRQYEKEDVTSGTVKTDAEGAGTFSFVAAKEGFYRVVWLSQDADAPPVKAETTVWVANNATTELGYRHGDLEIIVDKDTFRAGQKATVMLHTPAADRWVLFTVGSDKIFRREVIHLTGTVKMIEIDIGEEHVPNFWVQAVMVHDLQNHQDQKEIVVPPTKNFLQVEVKPDRDSYRVRDDGKFIVTTKNHEGKAVAAEVAFGVIDEAVFYIEAEDSRDPRQFFYGTKRYQTVMTATTFDQRGFRRDRANKEVDELESRGSRNEAYFRKARGPQSKLALADMVAAAPATRGLAAELAQTTEEPAVRSDFRSTILWLPDVKTDADGVAQIDLKFPDSVTTWKGVARAATAANEFGSAGTSVQTTQPIIVRLQAPRFFVVGDEVTVSAVINNQTDEAAAVAPEIFVEGLKLLGEAKGSAVSVKAHSEARVDWRVAVERAGEAKIRVTGKSSAGSDSMERTLPIHEHGIEKFISQSGKMRDREVALKLDLPARKIESTKLVVQVTPSLAVTMLDSLPYLLDYPYGCVEQTMSRFLPAAIIAKTLSDVGISPEEAMGRAFGGIETAFTNKTQPKGKKNLAELNAVIRQGVERLTAMRHGDGGWGWWSGGQSDLWMTAYVVWGLQLARGADVQVPEDLIQSGSAFLVSHLAEAEKQIDLQAWMLQAVSPVFKGDAPPPARKAFENIWSQREKLNAYSRALFAIAAKNLGNAEQAQTLIRNLENGVKRGEGTAHWGTAGTFWRWSEGAVETTAFSLKALIAVDPKNPLIEPTMNWMVKNRRGAQWSNTRDTAISLLALTDYLKASGELKPAADFEVLVNGTSVVTKKITAKEALTAPSRFVVDRKLLRDGANEVRIVRKSGDSPLYFATEATFFSLEEPVTAAANEIAARRQYFRLIPYPTLLKGNEYERVPFKEGEIIRSGERLEVSVLIEAKNDYEYLIFEDLKPAGFEAVQIRSGEGASARRVKADSAHRSQPLTEDDYMPDSRWVYQELRDRKVASFIDQLPQGYWELRYELRAEAPGKFHALPTLGHAMYVPEIRCNSVESRVEVRD